MLLIIKEPLLLVKNGLRRNEMKKCLKCGELTTVKSNKCPSCKTGKLKVIPRKDYKNPKNWLLK